jgi:hypothetical protein
MARGGTSSGVLLRVLVRSICIVVAVMSPLCVAQPASATASTHTYAAITAKVELGQTGHVTGSVSPARPGKSVTLQRLVGSSWQNRGSAALSSTSHFSFVFKPTVKGTYYYRVVKPAEAGYASSISARLTTTVVAKVRSLVTTYSPTASDSNYRETTSDDVTATTNGVNYSHSITMNYDTCQRCGVAYQEYAVGGTWGVFAATVGLADDSPTGVTGKLEVFVDGRSALLQTLVLGQTTRIHVGLVHVQRLRIQVIADSGPHIVLGTPILSSDAYATSTSTPVAAWLSDIAVVESDNNYNYSNVIDSVARLEGDYFGKSIGFDEGSCSDCGSAYSDRSIGRHFTTLRFRLGLDDSFATGSGQVTITGDGATIWSGTVQSGSASLMSLNVTNVLRLRITVSGPSGSSVQLADARLYA